MKLETFDVDLFLREYWQKRPLLIRNPWRSWANPLAPNDLAGLACEDGVEARLVTRTKKGWKLRHGPFNEARFAKLGKRRWTLLVQAVDHVVPDVAALIEPFRFVPNWRIDDVMVSYATDGGGVGPHFDHYDVFLVQGLGRRRWQVGAACDDSSALLRHDNLRLLASFEATDEWVLEPGDILYVPPGIAHDGVAVDDDCMTYSIGFRASSRSDLIANWCEHLLTDMCDDDRYADPDLTAQANPGEIQASAIDRLYAMVTDRMLDRETFARWFGRYNTARKDPDVDRQLDEPVPVDALRVSLARPLRRNPASRFSFIRHGAAVVLFVDGESFDCSGEIASFAELLCAGDRVAISPALARSDAAMALVATLLDRGCVAFDPDDGA